MLLLRNFTLCHREERSVRRSDLPLSEEIGHAQNACFTRYATFAAT